MNERLKILVCANYAKFFREAAKEEFEDIEIVEYPAQCMLHKGNTDLLEDVLSQTIANAPENAALLCGKLCPLLTVASEKEPRMQVLCSDICFSNIIGALFARFLLEKGARATGKALYNALWYENVKLAEKLIDKFIYKTTN